MKLALYAPILLLTAAITSSGGGSIRRPGRPWLTLLLLPVLALACAVAAAEPLAGTRPLETPGDLAEQMVAGIDRYLTRETEAATATRAERWKRDFSSPQAYAR